MWLIYIYKKEVLYLCVFTRLHCSQPASVMCMNHWSGSWRGDDGVPSNLQPAGSRWSAEGKEKVPKAEKREGGSVCREQIVAPVTEKGDKKLGKTPFYITGLNNVAQVTEWAWHKQEQKSQKWKE